jgi:hypothetical protein
MIKQETRGGKREGAGRKPSGQTVTVSFRIKEEWREPIKKVVRKEISKLKATRTP